MSDNEWSLRRSFWIAAGIVTAALLAAAYFYFDVASWRTLDSSLLTNLAQTGAIHDKDGNYVTTLVGKENRTVISMDDLPDHVINAFLAAEDLRFYKHPGFDVTRIFGAIISNLRSGGYGQGASTITQRWPNFLTFPARKPSRESWKKFGWRCKWKLNLTRMRFLKCT